MNKKQLLLQNSSLFAELERKGTQIKSLEIKLSDLKKENEENLKSKLELAAKLDKANILIAELTAKNNELLVKLQTSSVRAELPDENTKISVATILNSAEISENIHNLTNEQSEKENVSTNENFSLENTVAENIDLSLENTKTYGIKAIGEVTKAVALAVANASGEEKALILGKTEAFKYEVISIINSNLAADEGIEKIKTLKNELLKDI